MRTEFESGQIEFWRVSKRFLLQEGRTLREFVPALFQGRGWSEPFYALRDITFTVRHGETFGIIGNNGSGKSTALKLIAGVMAPTEGEVRVAGRVSPLIELGAGFHPDLTGRENIYLNASILGMSARETREQFEAIVDFAELRDFIDTPVKRYSSGMYVRLGFAVAVHSDPQVLLVDEVLSVGDAFFQEKSLAKMHQFQKQGVTIVVVSHGLQIIEDFCQRAIWLEHGRILAEGSAAEVVREYQRTVPHATEEAVAANTKALGRWS